MSVQATTWVWEEANEVTGSPLLVLLAIADAANRQGEASCQSVATLMKMTRLSESTVHRAIAWLVENGYIKSLGISPRYHTHVYFLPRMGGCHSDTQGGVTGDTQPQVTNPKEPLARPEPSEREPRPRTQLTEHHKMAFEEWWSYYPKKVGKQAAMRAYAHAIKSVDPVCILTGLQSQQAFLKAKHEEGFCPDPATWLRAGRWDDEVTPRQTPLGKHDPFDPKRETRDQYLIRAGYVS